MSGDDGHSILWAWNYAESLSRARPDPRHHLPRKSGAPIGFVERRDPKGRFSVKHPSSWVRADGAAFHVQSPTLGTFIRVEAAPTGGWESLLSSAGGRMTLEGREEGLAWGRLDLDRRRYGWEGILRGGWLLLIGNVVDSKRTAAVELYEERVLAAVRRSYRVPALSAARSG